MLFDRVGGRRASPSVICRATVPALIILITTVSCSGPPANLPPPIAEFVELFSGTEAAKQQLVQRDATQPKVGRPASKKASTSAQHDEKGELYQEFLEFLEWRSRQKDRGEVRSLH